MAAFSEEMLLRRAQSTAPDLDAEAPADAPRPDAGRAAAAANVDRLDRLRSEMQRKLAAQIDLSEPDASPQPASEVERVVVVPKVERRRMDSLRAEAQRNITTKVERRTLGSFLQGRRGLRITPSRILLMLVALIAGGAAAFLATQHEPGSPGVAQAVAQPAAQVVREARTQILVAKDAIGIGQRLTADSVQWEDWPQGAVRPEYVNIASEPDAMTKMAGSVTRFEFFPGEPIRTDKLALPGSGYLSAVLDKGMRGVSVTINADSASGGFIVPDDHVDVVATRTTDGHSNSETVLQNVRVLAIDKRLGETGKTGAPTDAADPSGNVFSNQAIATLELDPTQAEVIAGASSSGKLTLVLRSLIDFPKTAVNQQSAANEVIRLTSPFWAAGNGSTVASPH